MPDQTQRDDLVERLRRTQPSCIGGSPINPDGPEAADRIERLEADLRTVQNAAKTLHAARDTELQHIRENAAFDHKLRQEHQSLIDRDALMTDALLAAQAEIDRLREEVERLNACAQGEADAEAIACSWKARALVAETEVARLTASLAVRVPHAACPPSVSSGRPFKDTPHD